jgi:hypothetical protein
MAAIKRRQILENLSGASVRLNDLLIPPATLHSVLGRYVDNLVAWNDHDTFKVSLIGSAIPLKYRGRYFLICSQHQLRGWELERISIMRRGGMHVVSSAGVRFFDSTPDSDATDIAAFEFTEPCNNVPDLKERFFDFRGPPQGVSVDKILFFLASGFPSIMQTYDLAESNHIGTLKQKIVCFPGQKSLDPALMHIRPDRPLDFDPDGMSGGSVFVVEQIGTEFRANLAGMIVRAGKSNFYLLHAGIIVSFLNVCIGAPNAAHQ